MSRLKLFIPVALLAGILASTLHVWGQNKSRVSLSTPSGAATGAVWITQASGTTNQLNSVIWTGRQLVAVGDFGAIVTSPDGVTWTEQTSGTTNHLRSMIWTGSQLVAAGDGGTLLTSPDGVTWTEQTSGTKYRLVSMKWTGSSQAGSGTGQLVAVGYDEYTGTSVILTSPDGMAWASRDPGAMFYLRSVTWARSLKGSGSVQFIVMGGAETGHASSRKGSGTGKIVAMGGWSGKTTFLTSPDGVTWSARSAGTKNELTTLTWAGPSTGSGTGQFVAVGPKGLIMTSPDGVTWTSRASRTTNSLVSVSWTGPSAGSGTGQLVVGDFLGNILTSPDGVNWTKQSSGTTGAPIFSVTSIGTRLVAVGYGGTILTSP